MAWGHLVLAWRLVLDLRMLGLRSDHVGVEDSKVHMANEGVLVLILW
jgi:hypothetical protein